MAHVDLHKINELLQKIQHEDSSNLAQARATGKDHKLRSGRYHDKAEQDTQGMSDADMVDVIANLYYRLDKLHALESINEINPSKSPWTQSGKHPGAMNREELKKEIAVFDELRARGDHLSPKELAQEDSLYNYLDQTNEDETPNFNPKGRSFTKRADAARGMWASSKEIQKRFKTWQDFMKSKDFDDWLDDKFRDALEEDSGCPCCGCDSVAECTCSPDCPNCDCHSGVTEDDRYTKYASVPGRKYDKDDKAEAKLLSLQDRKSKLLKKLDRIADEGGKIGINDPEYKELQAVKKAIAGLKEKVTEKDVKCLSCGKGIPASTDHASEEPYNFICDDCRDEIGTGGVRENELKRRIREAEWGAEEYQKADAANMAQGKRLLEKLMRELDIDIRWRSYNSSKFFNNGDKAGTGHLESILKKLEDLHKNWDKETKLYGM